MYNKPSLLNFYNLLPAIISFFGALIGIIIGGFINRRTQHQNWIKETRSKIYKDFLNTLNSCITNATQTKSNTKARIESYLPVEQSAKIVRLFLAKNTRDKFENLVLETTNLHSKWLDLRNNYNAQKMLESNEYKKYKDSLNSIQLYLENSLKSKNW